METPISRAQPDIPPNPGRVVWYWPSAYDASPQGHNMAVIDGPRQPMAATVAFAWSNHLVNLSVIDHIGRQHVVMSVPLMQPSDEPRLIAEGGFAEWMPYQIGQAAKAR